MRQQNYNKLAQLTKITFLTFCKRHLASQILSIIQKNKSKKQTTLSQQQLQFEDDVLSNDSPLDKKNLYDDSESMIKNNTRFNKLASNLPKLASQIKITELCYGDYVIIDTKIGGGDCRIYSHLDSLKLFSIRNVPENIINLKKSCFQLVCPYFQSKKSDQKITSSKMIALRNVFTGHYINLGEELSQSSQFGYVINLKPQLQKSCIFRFVQENNDQNSITTDRQIFILSFYNQNLKISINQQVLGKKIDRQLIGSYVFVEFKLTKIQFLDNLTEIPYFYIRSVGIDKNLEIDQPTLKQFTVKNRVRQFEIQAEDQTTQKQPNILYQNDCLNDFYELIPIRQTNEFKISDEIYLNLCQIWQIEKIQVSNQSMQCKIRNVIANQLLSNQSKECMDTLINFKKGSIFQFKKQQNNQFTISNQQNVNLTAFYNSQTEKYALKYQQESYLQNQSMINKNQSFKFELIALSPVQAQILSKLIELNDILKYNYDFIQKWGFRYDQRVDKIKYSLSDFKLKINMMRQRIKDIHKALDRLIIMLETEKNMVYIQGMAKQLKLLELLIIYCSILKLKITKQKKKDIEIIETASHEMKPTLFKIFHVIFQLIFRNKACSQVIIQNNEIFNDLLNYYTDPISLIIEQSIKNLCILTNKITSEEEVIFAWTNHVNQIKNTEMFEIQKKYIDIIAEVVVDPNDTGIYLYQNKIKEQLIGNRRKKILPKFMIQNSKMQINQPIIIFQYDTFPANVFDCNFVNKSSLKTTFQLKYLFQHSEKSQNKQKTAAIEYIGSLLKLMRNLCKDRNKKLLKLMEDYGLTTQFMHVLFKNTEISWQFIARFLDLYCAMYLIQDPFLSFQKKQVKCYAWHKINDFDFTLKTSIIFNQFTQQNVAFEKHKIFDNHILPIFNKYFQSLSNLEQQQLYYERQKSFFIIISCLYEVINYGYLNHNHIQRYVNYIMKYIEVFISRQYNNQKKQKIIIKTIQLLTLAQQVWTIIQSMNLLRKIYKNLRDSQLTTNEQLKNIFEIALNYQQQSLQFKQQLINRRRKSSVNIKLNRQALRGNQQSIKACHPQLDFSIIQWIIKSIVQNKFSVNNHCLKELMTLLQIIYKRGERICDFLGQIYLLNKTEQQNLYIQYSGITPLGRMNELSKSSRRLLNVMKVKELVDKITEQNLDPEDQNRKKQKILQLKNLLMKIIKNLTILETKDYRLFQVCQMLPRKLRLHQILIEIMKFSDKDQYQSLINQIVYFYSEFVKNCPENQIIIAEYFPHFTKRYSYEKLPNLLPRLFTQITNQQQAFWLVYKNIDKKMENAHKIILFQCIYRILKICPNELLQKLKGQIIYTLTSTSLFSSYINAKIQCISFINLLCFIGKKSKQVSQKIKEVIKKTSLLENLTKRTNSYLVKSIFLKIYHFLYIQDEEKIDEMECQQLMQKLFLAELKFLPSTCKNRAQSKLKQEQLQKQFTYQMQNLYISLTMDSQSISTTEEQSYFLYLLNIDNENELSFLNCLKDILIKYSVFSIEPLSNYIFKLINFMERIFMKEEKIYQSRILIKLYEISTILQEKYNRTIKSTVNLTFQQAYPKVQQFFKKFAEIIQLQNISFYKIVKLAEIRFSDIQQYRRDEYKMKLILQSQFFQFMKAVATFINNRSQFLILASENSIKQFFKLYKERRSHKMNIIRFLSKLIEMLQFIKNTSLFSIYVQSKKSQQIKEIKASQKPEENINSQLLENELKSLKSVYKMHLSYYMQIRIKSKLTIVLKQAKQINCDCILDMHMKSQKCSIIDLVIDDVLKIANISSYFSSLTQRNWDDYLCYLLHYLQKSPNRATINILMTIYGKLQHKQSLFQDFIQFIKKMMTSFNFIIVKYQREEHNHIFDIYKQHNQLILIILQNQFLLIEDRQFIEKYILQEFIDIFGNYCANYSYYWYNLCQTILEKIIFLLDNFTNSAEILSRSDDLIKNLNQMIKQILSNGLKNTNSESQFRKNIFNSILNLIKKLNQKGYTQQVAKIISNWPFQLMISNFDINYSHLYEIKFVQRKICMKQDGCSQEFCNEDKLTKYDEQLIYILLNILIIIQIGTQIIHQQTNFKEFHQDNQIFLSNFNNPNQKSITLQRYRKFLDIVMIIDIKLKQKHQKLYFNNPLNESNRYQMSNNEIEDHLNHIEKDNYFCSLSHLSKYIESLFSINQQVNKGFIFKYFLANEMAFRMVFILYLLIICVNIVFNLFALSNLILYFVNTLIVFLNLAKLAYFVRITYQNIRMYQLIKFTYLFKIQKGCQLLFYIFTIISYFLQYSIPSFYAVTLFLELISLKIIKNMIIMMLQSSKLIVYLLIYSQSFFITIVFIVYERMIKGGGNQSIINVYINFVKELLLFSVMPINSDDPHSFPTIRNIPEFIPVIIFVQLLTGALFISKLFLTFSQEARKLFKKQENCQICGLTRQQLESKGVNYLHHIQNDHNFWNYINFFIYIRNKVEKQPEELAIFELIEKEDFRFFKI